MPVLRYGTLKIRGEGRAKIKLRSREMNSKTRSLTPSSSRSLSRKSKSNSRPTLLTGKRFVRESLLVILPSSGEFQSFQATRDDKIEFGPLHVFGWT